MIAIYIYGYLSYILFLVFVHDGYYKLYGVVKKLGRLTVIASTL